jgi:hypothetical protein
LKGIKMVKKKKVAKKKVAKKKRCISGTSSTGAKAKKK